MTQSERSIRLGTSFHEIGNTAISKMSYFFKKLDSCWSLKKEECVSELQSCFVLSFGFLGPWRWDCCVVPNDR